MHEIFTKRRSVRHYQKKGVEEEKLKEILKAAMSGPSGHNSRIWEFVVVGDHKTKEKLAESGPWADFVKEAPVVIVIVGDEKKSKLWLEDCSIAAGYIYLEAANQGLGTCWVHIREGKTLDGRDPEDFVRELLGIPHEKRILCLLPIGYPEDEIYKEKRFEPEKVHYGRW